MFRTGISPSKGIYPGEEAINLTPSPAKKKFGKKPVLLDTNLPSPPKKKVGQDPKTVIERLGGLGEHLVASDSLTLGHRQLSSGLREVHRRTWRGNQDLWGPKSSGLTCEPSWELMKGRGLELAQMPQGLQTKPMGGHWVKSSTNHHLLALCLWTSYLGFFLNLGFLIQSWADKLLL